MEFKRDCKSFPGQYSCEIMTAEGYHDCKDCNFYEPIKNRILIIKLGALGDVIRTIPILEGLKKKYPESQITWLIAEGESKDILENNPNIDRIFEYNQETLLKLKYEKFNLLINFDISNKALIASNISNAEKKLGFYLEEDGHPQAYNESAKYYLNRVFSNYANITNRKSYQEMMFEIAELTYNNQEIILNNIDQSYKNNFIKKYNVKENDKLVCINLGSGGRWPSKGIHQDNIIELIKKLKKENYKILLRGGPEEKDLLPEVLTRLKEQGIKDTLTNYPDILTIPQLTGLISLCNLVITGDTLVLHIATALKKKIIALFFCTPPWEIEDYNRIIKITSPMLNDNLYTEELNEELTKSISAEQIFNKIK